MRAVRGPRGGSSWGGGEGAALGQKGRGRGKRGVVCVCVCLCVGGVRHSSRLICIFGDSIVFFPSSPDIQLPHYFVVHRRLCPLAST